MRNKTYIMVVAALAVLTSCETSDELWLRSAVRPIVLVAEDQSGSVILRDSLNSHCVIPVGYAAAKAISQSYEVGDTLK